MRLSQAMSYRRSREAHPGFAGASARIARQPGIRNPGAVLGAGRQKAGPAAVAANPRLRRVATPGSHMTRGGVYR
jgi:hypothetical protein